ncbi:SRPBCC family protein [Actinomadura fulvescens]|uniref:SRPBCC family protein n=1 Tax=Actinomadura fulvescens TaxID=46160 RepID=A0ABN3PAQ9_9ACTN
MTIVRSDRAHTFEVFVRGVGRWWPGRPFSFGEGRPDTVHMDEALGGRIHETRADGTEHDWGRVTAWEPPARLAFTWQLPPAAGTEIEVRFAALGPNLTRVELEHRGFDKLPPEQLAAVPGDIGEAWSLILGRFAAVAEAG